MSDRGQTPEATQRAERTSMQPPEERLLKARTVFVSDFHLGSAGSQVDRLLDFFACLRCDTLYLVGDIIDGYVANRKGKWDQGDTNILRAILTQTRHETRVRYVPGNHDAFMRKAAGLELGNIVIEDQFTHETLDGKRFLVTHGDLFDGSVNKSELWPWVGTMLHEGMTVMSQKQKEKQREKGTTPKENKDLANAAKHLVKKVVQRLTSFEENITEHAKAEGYDGVICGHIHQPAFRESNGILYLNCGDWIVHCTALVEHLDGRFELLTWPARELEGDVVAEPETGEGRRRWSSPTAR